MCNNVNCQISIYDVKMAKKNWDEWKIVFEGPSDHTNHILTCTSCFNAFLQEYSVGRTIGRGLRNNLQSALTDPLDPIFMPNHLILNTIDLLNIIAMVRFGVNPANPRSMVSLFSKIAAFVNPCRFNALDKFSRKGIKKYYECCVERNMPNTMANYAEYMICVDDILAERRQEIADACIRHLGANHPWQCDRFYRRVLDRYLMRLGGRTDGCIHRLNSILGIVPQQAQGEETGNEASPLPQCCCGGEGCAGQSGEA